MEATHRTRVEPKCNLGRKRDLALAGEAGVMRTVMREVFGGKGGALSGEMRTVTTAMAGRCFGQIRRRKVGQSFSDFSGQRE